MALDDDQQFCLKWNNFQANITSQFETLREDEDFTDVTIACEGQRLQAHKVVLSACSPFFKELFKTNPCPHPIIFMRDVEVRHIMALMEFMYAGEVNVAQAHLSTFLKTAESLKIRGLTDTSTNINSDSNKDEDISHSNFQSKQTSSLKHKLEKSPISSSSTVTSSQDISNVSNPTHISSPASKRHCKSEVEYNLLGRETNIVQPKLELPDYLSDCDIDDVREENDDNSASHFYRTDTTELPGGMEIIPQLSSHNLKQDSLEQGIILRRRRLLESGLPICTNKQIEYYDDSSDLIQRRQNEDRGNRLVKLGEGIEIYEDQLRSVKWSDYRKLTRGLATILFSPAELATCSVTGQRWSRAGTGERPVKPALDKSKVQAIISYVSTRFPMVEISRIKQVLAYKCKENSTAFKMKAVRYYGETFNK